MRVRGGTHFPPGMVWCDVCALEYRVPAESPGYAKGIERHEATERHQRNLKKRVMRKS